MRRLFWWGRRCRHCGFRIAEWEDRALNADVFVPELGAGLDEIAHEADALGVLEDFEGYALASYVVFGALEGCVFADDDAGDFVEEDGAAAHGTGGKGGVEDALGVDAGGEAAGVFEAIHLGMVDDAAVLDALVVAAADDAALVDEDGADGDAAGGEALAGFFDGGVEKGVAFRHRERRLADGRCGIQRKLLELAQSFAILTARVFGSVKHR